METVIGGVILHQGKNIQVCCWEETSGVLAIKAALSQGDAYKPGTHMYGVSVEIMCGRGEFFLDDRSYAYEPGEMFFVPKHTLHGFVQIDEDTVFVKRINPPLH